jgi:hypothetical protein
LEENIDNDNANYTLIIKRIKTYIENYHIDNIDLKKSVSELNPYHTHYKYIKHFNELFSKNMRKSIDKSTRENSFLSILGSNTIQLSKGGGFKIGNKNEISQLGKVESGFIMPRSYFINPNKFELEKGYIIKQDWTDLEFSDIKTFLENE